MGFAVAYRSTKRVNRAKAEAVDQAVEILCHGRTWLSCEPALVDRDQDGHLSGSSKPNLNPQPEDVRSAAEEDLPDGTTRDVLDILCQISREHGVDWEIRHDYSNGPVGYIRKGVADAKVVNLMWGFPDLAEMVGDAEAEDGGAHAGADDDEDDGPSILPFRPRGE
jgi:hypothetical protein